MRVENESQRSRDKASKPDSKEEVKEGGDDSVVNKGHKHNHQQSFQRKDNAAVNADKSSSPPTLAQQQPSAQETSINHPPTALIPEHDYTEPTKGNYSLHSKDRQSVPFRDWDWMLLLSIIMME
eukprot:scaffold61233_cov66-Cyclotella_meneghiniana.AAC.4